MIDNGVRLVHARFNVLLLTRLIIFGVRESSRRSLNLSRVQSAFLAPGGERVPGIRPTFLFPSPLVPCLYTSPLVSEASRMGEFIQDNCCVKATVYNVGPNKIVDISVQMASLVKMPQKSRYGQ